MGKKSKSKREIKLEQRNRLLKQRGFRHDPFEGKWFFKEQSIDDSIVSKMRSLADLERLVNKINPPTETPPQFTWWLPPKLPSSSNSHLPYLDALDFRLPGSYGTGKRR